MFYELFFLECKVSWHEEPPTSVSSTSLVILRVCPRLRSMVCIAVDTTLQILSLSHAGQMISLTRKAGKSIGPHNCLTMPPRIPISEGKEEELDAYLSKLFQQHHELASLVSLKVLPGKSNGQIHKTAR